MSSFLNMPWKGCLKAAKVNLLSASQLHTELANWLVEAYLQCMNHKGYRVVSSDAKTLYQMLLVIYSENPLPDASL